LIRDEDKSIAFYIRSLIDN